MLFYCKVSLLAEVEREFLYKLNDNTAIFLKFCKMEY